MGALDFQLVERGLEEGAVALDGKAEAVRLVRVSEAGHVQSKRPRERGDPGQQVVPIAPRARIAVDEHDGLGRVRRPGGRHGHRQAVDVQTGMPDSVRQWRALGVRARESVERRRLAARGGDASCAAHQSSELGVGGPDRP